MPDNHATGNSGWRLFSKNVFDCYVFYLLLLCILSIEYNHYFNFYNEKPAKGDILQPAKTHFLNKYRTK